MGGLLLILAVVAAGCVAAEDPIDEARLVPSVRLADVHARAGRWREPAMVTIGTTSRYVLGRRDVVPIEVQRARPKIPPKLQADASGELDLAVRCPLGVKAPHVLRIELLKVGRDAARVSGKYVTRRLGAVCGEGRAGWQPVRVDGLHPKARFFTVVASLLRRPPPVVVSPVVDVPEGAELRVALGLRAAGAVPAGAFDVRVTAVVPAGGRRVVARRLVRPHDVAPPGEWVEWRIPLDGARRAVGTRMRFTFEATSRTGPDGLLHVLWGDPTIWSPPQPELSRRARNLVLVSLDTMRADRLGAAGFPLDVTPNLDRLAGEGVMFTDAVSSANWTKPAHATMLTGTFPCVHRVDWGGEAMDGPLPAGIVPIAERLRTAGWATAAFTEDAYVSPDVFQRGFDVFVADVGDSAAFSNIEQTVAAASRWIADNAARPFFVLVHTYQVHEPYEPPAEYAALANMAAVPAAPGLRPPADDAMADAAAYVGEVAYTDAVIGRLLRRIDDLGLRDDTVVVVTSDHGEAFGEHGLRYHGQGLEREQVRVPLIIRAPGVGAAGRRIDGLVSLADVAPTVLELLGFEAAPWVQGMSLVDAMRAEDRHVPLGRTLPLRGMGNLSGIRGATWKVRRGKHSRIWDLRADPAETHHRTVPEATVEALERAVEFQCERGRKLVAEAAEHRRKTRRSQVSIEERMKLRALGYVE